MNKNYEILDHTADIRIRVSGISLSHLFVNAAAAMFDIIAENIACNKQETKALIIQEAEDKDELFINWLNELHSLSAAKNIIFKEFKVNKLTETSLEISCTGYPATAFKISTEIKAATYHELKIQEKDKGWEAEVIFDV